MQKYGTLIFNILHWVTFYNNGIGHILIWRFTLALRPKVFSHIHSHTDSGRAPMKRTSQTAGRDWIFSVLYKDISMHGQAKRGSNQQPSSQWLTALPLPLWCISRPAVIRVSSCFAVVLTSIWLWCFSLPWGAEAFSCLKGSVWAYFISKALKLSFNVLQYTEQTKHIPIIKLCLAQHYMRPSCSICHDRVTLTLDQFGC